MLLGRLNLLKKSKWMALLWGTVLPLLASAQAAPGIAEVLRQTKTLVPMSPTSTPPSIQEIPPSRMTALPDGGPSVRVKAIHIDGNQSINEATLQALLADAVDGFWTLAQLEDLATRLTLYYRQKGFVVARAYVPAQDLTDGRLRLRVVEGKLGRVLLDNRSRVRDQVVRARVEGLSALPALHYDDLEAALLNVNALPGAQVERADLLPGQTSGTTDLALIAKATAPVLGQITLDNEGSRYTGRERLGLQAEWTSPAELGDRLSLGMLASTKGDLAHGRLAWSVPVSHAGTRVEGALARTLYRLGDRYAALGANGTAEGIELNVLHPWQRSRAVNVDLGLGLLKRRLTDETASVGISLGKRSEALALRVLGQWQHALLGNNGTTQVVATLTTGHLSFDDAVAAAQDASGRRTAGSWSKFELSTGYSTSWAAGWQLGLRARLQRALSAKNLDGSERIGISGANGVQAYPVGEAAGDHGAVVSGELTRGLGFWNGAIVRSGVFTALGVTSVADQSSDLTAHRRLADSGLMLSISSGQWQLRGALAHRIKGGESLSEPSAATRLLIQATMNF